jgi:EpsI family protein
MIGRALILSAAILAAGFYGSRAVSGETGVPRETFASFPRGLAAWPQSVDVPIAGEALAILGADDYLSRTFVGAAAAPPVNLYVGYYGSQRQGDAIHSPQNCLPGAGWQPVEGGRVALDLGGRTVTVNRYVIQKGLDRQVALYWYQGRGRVVANEYANKLWLMIDAARLHRSNGALVRVMAPAGRAAGGLDAADAAASAFVRGLFPTLPAYLP